MTGAYPSKGETMIKQGTTMKWVRKLAVPLLVATTALLSAGIAQAAPPTPPFNQCPPVGLNSGCAVLIVFNADGSLSSYNDLSQGPFDGIEDTLVGVQNNRSTTVTSLQLTGPFIFGFDSDGVCAGYSPGPSGCPFGPTGYEGPNTSFTAADSDNGTVNFLNGAIRPGGSAYFSLEEAVTCTSVGGNVTCSQSSDPPITAQGTTFGATEGAGFTGTVATFDDPDPDATPDEYAATIDWGDGTASTSGTIAGSGGHFTVGGTHTYAEEGHYPVTVTISDVDNPSNTDTAQSTANVADAPLSSNCATAAGVPRTFSGPTATFTDADPAGAVSDYTATINWGDNSSSAGTVTGGPGHGPYTVKGSHTYAGTGPVTITTVIADAGGSKTTATCRTVVYATPSGGGSFVIGDRKMANTTKVLFWGAQWSSQNPMSGGSAPSSFKGFAKSPTSPSCG